MKEKELEEKSKLMGIEEKLLSGRAGDLESMIKNSTEESYKYVQALNEELKSSYILNQKLKSSRMKKPFVGGPLHYGKYLFQGNRKLIRNRNKRSIPTTLQYTRIRNPRQNIPRNIWCNTIKNSH